MPEETAAVSPAHSRPTGVRIISILYYLAAILSLISGLALLFSGGLLTYNWSALLENIPLIGFLGTGLAWVLGIIIIILAVIYFLVGRGLAQGQNWARILAIIFALLGIIKGSGLLTGPGLGHGLLRLIIHLAIGGYLLFSPRVKAYFA